MAGARRFHRSAARRGFVVVAVLWMLAMLAVLAGTFLFYVMNTTVALGRHGEKLQAEALVTAAVELTAYRLTAQGDQRPIQGSFYLRSTSAEVNIVFRGETARIDLNRAPPELLVGLFVSLGAAPRDAEAYAARIVGWRTQAEVERPDAEAALYRGAGLPYGPRGGPFPHVAELALVLGLPEGLMERALPYVTVYSGQPNINPALAAPEVLAALPGITPQEVYAALAQRSADPQNIEALIARLGPASSFVTAEGSRSTRVTVDVNLRTGRRTRTEVVILVVEGADAEPYRILSWSDEVYDVPAPTQLRTDRR